MSRLTPCFEALRHSQRKAVIPYIVAGDPDVATTVPMLHSLVAAGADILELGVPFSDPMSEGPVIQRGHERALANDVSLTQVLGMVVEFRQRDQKTPIVIMGYANPVERMGYANFASECAAAGVDGLITVDLPPEEVGPLNAELQQVDIDNIFLISPTTPAQRIATIAANASGFIYYVAVKGVTGAGNLDSSDVGMHLDVIRAATTLPICVGFGIKDAESATSVGAMADGVVVGSALIDTMIGVVEAGGSLDGGVEKAVALLGSIRAGIDNM
ncbi:tryptophan synthase subunit alpha [Luminiphilus sp. nBUS_16]|uniref:tryptophan synthase subunit alpha n=1 Tax=unclassified Luminiphilus TaxID=2633198 RepID=UPI003EBC6BCA